jgi:hypothetical protein
MLFAVWFDEASKPKIVKMPQMSEKKAEKYEREN